ncbi:MAG: chemotaxis protein MotB, partial [Nitrospirae bacterium]
VIGENIAEIGNKLYIEGHTDSVNYSERRNYSNWELSTERANAARRFLEDVGITPDRIIRVIGYADRDPVDSKHPEAAINRRISIVVLFPERPPPEEKG